MGRSSTRENKTRYQLAREELGLVTPDEYVFYDVSN